MKTKLIGVIFSLLLSTAHGAAHSVLVMEDTIKLMDKICTREEYPSGHYSDIKTCSTVEYKYVQGFVFAKVDTLQGAFFGFSEPRLYDYQNGIEDAVKNLAKTINKNCADIIYIANHRWILKFPRKLIYYPYEVPPPASVIAYYHLATIYKTIVARYKELFRNPGRRRFFVMLLWP